ncbi:MAG: glycosyltransferase [Alphaproteobacteria bacterium]|nr:glycosyltransferase [Alphaproteobacteria bacterium]
MRVIKYVAGWPPARFPNGIVTATSVLSPVLRARGCDVRILAGEGESEDANVSIVNIGSARDRSLIDRVRARLRPDQTVYWTGARNIERAIVNSPDLRQADLLEIEESFGWCDFLRRRLSMPVVVGLHGPWFLTGAAQTEDGCLDPLGLERVRREGEAIAHAEAISSRSRHVLNAVREQYGLKLEQAVVIPNPARRVEPDFLWKREAADPNEILFIGRFDRVKGADVIIRAFAKLAAERPNLRLTFAGPNKKPISMDGHPYQPEAFLKSVMPPEAAARVAFLGFTPTGDLPALRRRAFVTVVASRIEIFPNVLLEALAHGSPVVATSVGGIPEIARPGEDALLVESNDPNGLAEAIATLLDNAELAARIGETGRRRVESEFSPERIAAITMDYYEDLIARRAKARR